MILNTNVLSAAITKPTREQQRKVNSLMRDYQILVDSNGVARIYLNRVQKRFVDKVVEILCE